jgi:hypothetical protein
VAARLSAIAGAEPSVGARTDPSVG